MLSWVVWCESDVFSVHSICGVLSYLCQLFFNCDWMLSFVDSGVLQLIVLLSHMLYALVDYSPRSEDV